MRLYVGNIPFASTADDIREAFAVAGAVTRVDMVMNRDTGVNRGFAFVDIDDAAADSALALDGSDLGGRRLVVNRAKDRQKVYRTGP